MPRIDILINNAAQTIRRPPAFYRHFLRDVVLPGPVSPGLAGTDLIPLTSNVALALDKADRERAVAMLSQVTLLPGDEDSDPDQFPEGMA